ncbi:MAG: serine/threonine-protein kinase [Acidobacteriota bacterium]
MEPALWMEVKKLVAEMADLGPAEREKWLDRAESTPTVRREVGSLLAALDARGSWLEEPVRLDESLSGPEVGEQVGAYRLRQRLGGGGMGEVFLAVQEEPIAREVAVKFIRTGLASEEAARRFESERQALALMGHRSIARVYEVGSHRGRPFLAMERIDGEPIDRYCDRNRLGVGARLRLFQTVCRGVQHAHMKGVIHRDLKPSNVLVFEEDGMPTAKIIDFGIAKFIEEGAGQSAMTVAGQWLGTPDYMSPEQASGAAAALDTRSDVFSLGVMLYELLCGHLPLDARALREREGLDAWLRALREDDPPSMASLLEGSQAQQSAACRATDVDGLRRRVAGDLEAVLAKALSREPERRYTSPAELAEDIGRHLGSEPVVARAPTTAYVVRRWMLRHRAALAASAILALTFLLGFVGTGLGFVRARAAEQTALEEAGRAQREASTANQVKTFLVDLFRALNTDRVGATPNVTLRDLLDRGAERIRDELQDEPEVQAELMTAIAGSYGSLALWEPALELHRDSVEIFKRRIGPASNKTVSAMNDYGVALNLSGAYGEAEAIYREILESPAVAGGNGRIEAYALNNMASALKNQGRFEEGLEAVDASLEIRRRLFTDNGSEIAVALTVKGLLLTEMDRAAEAVAPLEQALHLSEASDGVDHPRLALPLNNLAIAHTMLGQRQQAIPYIRRAIAIDEQVYGASHPNVAAGYFNLATMTLEEGDCAGALEMYGRVLEIVEEYYPVGHGRRVGTKRRIEKVKTSCGLS